jgi:integrase
VHPEGYLFPKVGKAGEHVDQKAIGVAVYWHMPRCQIRPQQQRARWPVEGWSPHDLRRTVRTHLARLSCPDTIAEAVLGHIDTDAGIYNRHEYRAERLEWLTRLSQAWEEASRR